MINIFHEEIIDKKLLSFVYNSPIYKKTDIEDCDFIVYEQVLWTKLNIEPTLKSISNKYKHIDRFVIVFIVNDEKKPYKQYKNIVIVRTSLTASKRKPNELVMPYIWECLSSSYSPLIIKKDKPTVGFCGLNSVHRQALIKIFSESSSIESSFIIREQFWGGSPHDFKVIKEYNDNIEKNVFIISQRGAGNYSMRFYQTLAAGRIPVLVNTDMILPFENKIYWNDLIVFEKDEESCLKKVIEVFENGKYIRMQEECAKIFDSYFSDANFFSKLINQIFTMF